MNDDISARLKTVCWASRIRSNVDRNGCIVKSTISPADGKERIPGRKTDDQAEKAMAEDTQAICSRSCGRLTAY